MSVNWKKGYQPDQIVERIEALRLVNPDGKVRFEGFVFKEYEAVLFRMLEFSEDIPEMEARSLLWQSLVKVGSKGTITAKFLIAELNKLQGEYQRTPVSRYALLTSLSIQSEVELPRLAVGRDQLIFNKIPVRFHREAEPLIEMAKYSIFSSVPDDYMPVRVHISSRSTHEAADKALDHLDLIRAIWNWFYNRRHPTRMSVGGKPKPVNKIIIGPIHTLHKPNGELAATETWWYETSFLEPVMKQNVSQDVDKLYRFLQSVRERLSKLTYANTLEIALRRYARSLDERDWNNAYLRLWSVLELLTHTRQESYDVTIRRASYVFAERDYYFQVLKHLREYRNSSIHHYANDSEIEAYLYQLKNIVEAVLWFHVSSDFGFSSIQEAGEFLSLPYKREALELRRRMSDHALKFRRYE